MRWDGDYEWQIGKDMEGDCCGLLEGKCLKRLRKLRDSNLVLTATPMYLACRVFPEQFVDVQVIKEFPVTV
jgi:hypothetical protein